MTERDYKILMAEMAEVLKSGPQTTSQLYVRFTDWPSWQVNNCIGYMGAIRVKGERPRSPSLVYHPHDVNAPKPEIDVWLQKRLEKAPVPSSTILDEARELGHAESAVKQAQTRLGVTAIRSGSVWYKALPGQQVDHAFMEISDAEIQAGATRVCFLVSGAGPAGLTVGKIRELAHDWISATHRETVSLTEAQDRVRRYCNYASGNGLLVFDRGDRTYSLTDLGTVVADYALDVTWRPGMTEDDVRAEA